MLPTRDETARLAMKRHVAIPRQTVAMTFSASAVAFQRSSLPVRQGVAARRGGVFHFGCAAS